MDVSTTVESTHVGSHLLQDYPARSKVVDSAVRDVRTSSEARLPEEGQTPGVQSIAPPSRSPTLQRSSSTDTKAIKLSTSSKFLLYGLARCITTWILMGALYLSLWLYKDRVINPGTKSVFDTINVALSIALGLNVASSLKEIARHFRWWILQHGEWPMQEAEFILVCDSMTNLLKMMWTVPRPGTIAVCMAWLAINLLAQAGIASLSLTYSAVPGPGDVFLSSVVGNISVPDLGRFAPENDRIPNDFYGEAYSAHILGDIGSSYKYSSLPEQKLDGSSWASHPAAYWNATDHWEYVSLNSTPLQTSNGPSALSFYTNRIIKSSGVCATPVYELRELFNNPIPVAEFTIRESGEIILFPLDALHAEGTHYLSSPFEKGVCGPGCGNVKVVETRSGLAEPGSFAADGTGVFFYDCNITVTPSADLLPGYLPITQASVAARAIALSGAIPPLGDKSEYVFYNMGVKFGKAQHNNATRMASQLARFAIGVIAAAAQTNQPKLIPGHIPLQGLRLTLDFPVAFSTILGLTAGIQLLLVILTGFVCRRTKVPAEMPLMRRETLKQFIVRKPD